jgi:hypothetical protein
MLNEATIYDVRYTSIRDGEVSERTIIPTYVPKPVSNSNIKALDVSHLTAQEQVQMQTLLQEYEEYKKAFLARMFDFQTWLDHSTGQTFELKYRTFAQENLELLQPVE